jgi:hypothetical protein
VVDGRNHLAWSTLAATVTLAENLVPMEDSTPKSYLDNLFTRNTIHDGERRLIACRCKLCGAVMFSGANEFTAVEEMHVKWCSSDVLTHHAHRSSWHSPQNGKALDSAPPAGRRRLTR